jgi:hypothetical protein
VANFINSGAKDSSGSIGSKFELSNDSHQTSPIKTATSRVVELRLG